MIHVSHLTDSGEPIRESVEEVRKPTCCECRDVLPAIELPEWTGPFLSDAELSACDAEFDAYYGDRGVGRRS